MQLGKKGITSEFIVEIRKNIKANYDVRVRIQRSALGESDRFELFSKLKELLPRYKCKLVGNVVIVTK